MYTHFIIIILHVGKEESIKDEFCVKKKSINDSTQQKHVCWSRVIRCRQPQKGLHRGKKKVYNGEESSLIRSLRRGLGEAHTTRTPFSRIS